MLRKGIVQVYTGDGKGKTTAAFGLALRAAGHGYKVLIYQFLKPDSLHLGERASLGVMENITVKVLDEPWDMWQSLGDMDSIASVADSIEKALDEIETAAHERYYDVIILDEMVFCLSKRLVGLERIRRIIEIRDPAVEIVLTGRGASRELIEMADLVTEMKMVKHPYKEGMKARKGIEY